MIKPLTLLFLLYAFSCCVGQVQNSSPVFQSPNTASLGTYGAIDISPYTGLGSIGVNVFSVKEGDITVNCRLNYFSGGVKPSTHPGWVGQNWSLNVGGVVSRKINGGVDEVASSYYTTNENQFAYYYNYSYLNSSSWYTTSYITGLYPNNSTSAAPVLPNLAPDEFLFNLPNGTSGSFFLNHLGNWIVKTKSESDIKVTVQTNTASASFPQPFHLVSLDESSQPLTIDIKRLIYVIEITDHTGFKYTFGNNPNSIEFTRGPHSQPFANNEDVIANAWYLTKVESPAGNVVNFNYTRGVQGHQYHQNVNYPGSVGMSINGGARSYTQSMATYSGHIITPVYLQNISASSFQIGFTMAESLELKYPYQQGVYNDPKFNFIDIQTHDIPTPTSQDINQVSKWYKLTAIAITDPQGITKEKYAFEYNDNTTERLFLKKFKRLGLASSDNPITHEFVYNATPLPGYNALQNDRWGYYNGKPFPATISASTTEEEVMAKLAMDETKAQAGILTGIIYPTGGVSNFYYQANDYTSAIQKTGTPPASIGLIAQSGIGGGLRIWKVTNTDTDGHSYTTEYKYLKSATNTSSGILAGNKKIHKQISISTPPPVATIDAYDMNDFAELDYTNGRDVVYSEVKKILPDNSYVIYKYSNSDNSNYIDEPPLNICSDGYKATTFPYAFSSTLPSSDSNPFPSHNSKELERGQLLSEESYTSAGTLVRKVAYTYNADVNRFNEFVRSYDNYTVQAEVGSLLANERYFQAVKIFTYYPYLSGKTETVYDQVSATPRETTYSFSYGVPQHKQKKLTTVQNSKNEVLTESIIYNKDVADDTPLAYLSSTQRANLIAMYLTKGMIVPVHVSKSVDGTITNQERYSFKTNYLLDYIENATGSNSLEVRMNINNYDAKGNITEHQKSSDIKYAYLYEYNVPVAEIVNADYASVAYTGFENGNGNWNVPGATNTNYFTGKRGYALSGGNITKSSLPLNTYRISFWGFNNPTVQVNGVAPVAGPTRNGWTYYEFTTGSISSVTISGSGVIDELRLCPASARMTTYAYDPLVGYTAKVESDGNVVYFEYDSFNRLKWIKDKDRNIVKAYDYNYQIR